MQKKHRKLTACAVAAMLGLSCMVYPVHAQEVQSSGQADTGGLLELDETAEPLEESTELSDTKPEATPTPETGETVTVPEEQTEGEDDKEEIISEPVEIEQETQSEATEQTKVEAEPQEQTETVNMLSSARASAVSYRYYENGTWKTNWVTDYTVVTSGMDTTWESGWYVVDRNVTFDSRIVVKQEAGVEHTVNLILKDGCTLIANQGIEVENDSGYGGSLATLNIYAQSTGSKMGALIAQGKDTQGWGAQYDAIGRCVDGADIGNISIYGGRITATANETVYGPNICGITSPTIYGGIVTATSRARAGYGIGAKPEAFKPYGNAIVFADRIEKTGDTSGWKGVIFEGNWGKVYGTQTTIDISFEIPGGYTLENPTGTTFVVPNDVMINNLGSIANNGTIDLRQGGKITGNPPTGSGTILYPKAPTPTVTIDTSKTTASSITVTELENKDTYGGAEYSLDGHNWQSGNVLTDLHSNTAYTVYARYKGNNNGYAESDAGKIENVSTNTATYTITIPAETVEAGNSESKAELKPSDEFDLGYGGTAMVKVKENSGVDNDGKLTLTRQNDTENYTITSALLVNGTALGNINNSVATFTMNNKTPVSVSFAKPTDTNIPAGTYNGTITFEVSYSEQ